MSNYFAATCPFPASKNDRDAAKMQAVRDALEPLRCQLEERYYAVTLTFHGRWERNGKPIKRDVANLLDLLLDVVKDVVGVDDRWFRPITLDAVEFDGEEYVEIELASV